MLITKIIMVMIIIIKNINNNNTTTKPRIDIVPVNKNQIYSTYPIFIFQTSFREILPPFSILHHHKLCD